MEIKIHSVEKRAALERAPRFSPGRRELIGEAESPLPMVVLRQSVLDEVHAHAAATHMEVCGLLVGEFVTWEGQDYVELSRAFAGATTDASAVHVTFSHATWADLLRRKDRELPEASVVGWYHSHPHMGIFMSGMDIEVQQAFFPEHWQLGLVIDPYVGAFGIFVNSGADVVGIPRLQFLHEEEREEDAYMLLVQDEIFVYEKGENNEQDVKNETGPEGSDDDCVKRTRGGLLRRIGRSVSGLRRSKS